MHIIGLQFDIQWEDKPANLAKVTSLLEQAAPAPGSLVILPEMFATGFSMNVDRIAEPYGGPTEKFLSETAACWQIHLVAGLAARDASGHARNKALVHGPRGELVGYYAKRRLFSPGAETEHYVAGKRPFIFSWAGIKVSTLVCYDLRFPELFREAAAQSRPELFVLIANWPAKRRLHWQRLLQARAIENQAYVAAVNRIGHDPLTDYHGQSLMIDPHGEILMDAGDKEGCTHLEPDLVALRKYRAGLAFLDDLRL